MPISTRCITPEMNGWPALGCQIFELPAIRVLAAVIGPLHPQRPDMKQEGLCFFFHMGGDFRRRNCSKMLIDIGYSLVAIGLGFLQLW